MYPRQGKPELVLYEILRTVTHREGAHQGGFRKAGQAHGATLRLPDTSSSTLAGYGPPERALPRPQTPANKVRQSIDRCPIRCSWGNAARSFAVTNAVTNNAGNASMAVYSCHCPVGLLPLISPCPVHRCHNLSILGII